MLTLLGVFRTLVQLLVYLDRVVLMSSASHAARLSRMLSLTDTLKRGFLLLSALEVIKPGLHVAASLQNISLQLVESVLGFLTSAFTSPSISVDASFFSRRLLVILERGCCCPSALGILRLGLHAAEILQHASLQLV